MEAQKEVQPGTPGRSQVMSPSSMRKGSTERRDSVISVIYHQLSVNTKAILDGSEDFIGKVQDESMYSLNFKIKSKNYLSPKTLVVLIRIFPCNFKGFSFR
jgi:hypothetical protein